MTKEMLDLIAAIDANRMYFNSIPIPPEVKSKIRRISLLKSSLFSARIEGNPLTVDDVETTSNRQKKLEVFNILSAIKFLEADVVGNNPLTKEDILTLHRIVMKGLEGSAGILRTEMGAIFNKAGAAVYLTPPPGEITGLMDRLIGYINSPMEKFPLIKAFLAHLIFEKIHPFIDGNGRTGRLLILSVLARNNWSFNLNVVLEEFLDDHREDYYHFLDTGMKQSGDYLLFMLTAFHRQSEKIKLQIEIETAKKDRIILPPRQEEIYRLIVDHKMVSFDTVRRRFLKVPERTLRYDLKKLQEKKAIRKTGSTRGAFYSKLDD